MFKKWIGKLGEKIKCIKSKKDANNKSKSSGKFKFNVRHSSLSDSSTDDTLSTHSESANDSDDETLTTHSESESSLGSTGSNDSHSDDDIRDSSNHFNHTYFIKNQLSNLGDSKKSRHDPNEPLNHYSQFTKDYINSFEGKEKNTEILQKLQLSEEEEKLLEAYIDPVTMNVINIPVTLNGHIYDLDSLLETHKKYKLEPTTRYPFTLRDIQPAREVEGELQKIIQKIVESHKQNKDQSLDDESDNYVLYMK